VNCTLGYSEKDTGGDYRCFDEIVFQCADWMFKIINIWFDVRSPCKYKNRKYNKWKEIGKNADGCICDEFKFYTDLHQKYDEPNNDPGGRRLIRLPLLCWKHDWPNDWS